MLQPFKILKAWVQVARGFTTQEHKRRAAICSSCPDKKYTHYLDFINDDLKEVKGFVCTPCGCPLIAKIRSTDKCKKWEKLTTTF